jgi:hypothetical protein
MTEREDDRSPSYAAMVKNVRKIYLPPQYVSMAWCLVTQRERLYFFVNFNFKHREVGVSMNTSTDYNICISGYEGCRSQWPRGLKHELPSPARKLGSWVRISLEAWMSVCSFCVCAVLCVSSGFATGWSPAEGVLPTVYKITKLKKRPGPNKGL